MTRRSKLLTIGAIAVVVAAAGTGLAVATGGDDSEAPIEGTALDRASAAAREHNGGGEVTETEVGVAERYYEVEVTLDDGSQVDVQLDRGFNVVGGDADAEDGEEGAADD